MKKTMFCAVNNRNCGKKGNSGKKAVLHAKSNTSAIKERNVNTNMRMKVGARKTSGGVKLSLIRYLKDYQKENIDYSVINDYFRSELKEVGLDHTSRIFIEEMLTYDKRAGDLPKDYDEVINSVTNASSMIGWGSLYDIIQGLNYKE